MSKKTSITIGPHFESFIDRQLKTGRFSSASEVIRTALRLLEEEETRLSTLRKLLEEGEKSGFSDYTLTGLIDELNNAGEPISAINTCCVLTIPFIS